jgi:S1-C subfamily serine protease
MAWSQAGAVISSQQTMHLLLQKAFRSFASPSNVAMAVLVGFLSVGYITDWKMLRGRTSKSAMAVTPDLPEHATCSINSRLGPVRSESGGAVSLQVAPRSQVADRRPASREGKSRPELD